MDEGFRGVEGDILGKMKESDQTINDQRDTNQQLTEELEQTKLESEKAKTDRQEEHKLRLETDKQMKEIKMENEKLN